MADSYVDSLDPEKLMQCPYDKNHQIRACRFPYHLVKCRKNHPDIVQQLVTCPFNARHQVPRAEISQHISSCDDKRFIEQDIACHLGNYRKEASMVSMWQSPPCEEDWDKDLGDGSKSVFIWGISRCETNSGSGGMEEHMQAHYLFCSQFWIKCNHGTEEPSAFRPASPQVFAKCAAVEEQCRELKTTDENCPLQWLPSTHYTPS